MAEVPQSTSPKHQEMHSRPAYVEDSGILFTDRSESTEDDAFVALGQGVFRCKYKDGSVYVGGWCSGARQGPGEMRWSTGNTYAGNWSSGRPMGTGTMELTNGKQFTGNWENHNYAGSKDVALCQLASVGKWLQAMNDGYIWLWYNSSLFLPSQQLDLEPDPYSRTIPALDDHQIFAIRYMVDMLEKSFSHEEIRPHSMKQQQGLKTYVGCHTSEQPDGVGKIIFGLDCWYEGEFSNGVMQGLGIYRWPGKVVRGWWRNGMLDGYGDIEDRQGYRKAQWSQGRLYRESKI